MPLFICIVFAPLLIALLVALKASGRKRVLAWCVFALLALPLSVGGAGGWLLYSKIGRASCRERV